METLIRDTQERILLLLDYNSIFQYAKANDEAAEVVYSKGFWKRKIDHDTKVSNKSVYFRDAVEKGWFKIVETFILEEIIPRDEIHGMFSFDTLVSLCPFTEGIDDHFRILRLFVERNLVTFPRNFTRYKEVHPKVAVFLQNKGILDIVVSSTIVSNNLSWFVEYIVQGGKNEFLPTLVATSIVRSNNLEYAKKLDSFGKVQLPSTRISNAMVDELKKHPNVTFSYTNRALRKRLGKKETKPAAIKEPIMITRPEHIAIWDAVKKRDVDGLWTVYRKYSPVRLRVYYETIRGNKGSFFLGEHSLEAIKSYLKNPTEMLPKGYDYVADFVTDTVVHVEVYEYIPKS